MLVKLTKGKALDKKMKRQIFGGADCSDQCLDDCNSDSQIRSSLNGDSTGKGGLPEQPV